MAYRLLAADYDLTLTRPDRTVSPAVRSAIRAAAEALIRWGAGWPGTCVVWCRDGLFADRLNEAAAVYARLAAQTPEALTDPVAAANNGKASVALEDGVITVTADVNELEESESSAPGQGTHKWIGLGVGTGLASVALAKYNGGQLTDADAAEAVSVGLDQPGEFVLYIRADEVVDTPKAITLKADGYPEVAITICVVAPTSPEQDDPDQTE